MFFKKDVKKSEMSDFSKYKSSGRQGSCFTLMQDVIKRFPNDILENLQLYGYQKVVSQITKQPMYIYPFRVTHSVTKNEGLAGIVVNPLTYLEFQITVQLLQEVEGSNRKHLDVLVQNISEVQLERVTYPNPEDLLNLVDDEDMEEMLIAQLENGEGIMALLASFAPLNTELSYEGLRYLSYHNLLRSPVPIEIGEIFLGEVSGDLFVSLSSEECVAQTNFSSSLGDEKVKLKSEELIRLITYIHGQVDDRFTALYEEGIVGNPEFDVWIPSHSFQTEEI